MGANDSSISLLLIDNDPEFHASARTLEKAGFHVRAVAGIEAARKELEKQKPDLLILDVAAGGLQTLRTLREESPLLAAIILAHHSSTPDNLKLAGKGEVVFIAKPVNLDELVATIRRIVTDSGEEGGYREHTVRDLMVSPDLYPRLYAHEPVSKVVKVLAKGMFHTGESDIRTRLRSALVFDKSGRFLGMIRLNDLLAYLKLPSETEDYALGLTGLFHHQCRRLMSRLIGDVMSESVTVDVNAPLMEVVQTMVAKHQINLPVMDDEKLVGVIRDKDILVDVAGELGLLDD